MSNVVRVLDSRIVDSRHASKRVAASVEQLQKKCSSSEQSVSGVEGSVFHNLQSLQAGLEGDRVFHRARRAMAAALQMRAMPAAPTATSNSTVSVSKRRTNNK